MVTNPHVIQSNKAHSTCHHMLPYTKHTRSTPTRNPRRGRASSGAPSIPTAPSPRQPARVLAERAFTMPIVHELPRRAADESADALVW